MKLICVSVCAKTAAELIENIKRAEELADVIEVRFDCLEGSEFDSALEKIAELSCEKPFLATFRPKNEHSRIIPAKIKYENDEVRELHLKHCGARVRGWLNILDLENIKYVDFERDIQGCLYWDCLMMEFAKSQNEKTEILQERLLGKLGGRELIFSEHYFEKEKVDLEETYRELTVDEKHKEGSQEFGIFYTALIKIAIQIDEISESLELWKLLKKAKAENRKLIPIAMGEAGKWTRILGPAYGAPMTYASLETGKEVAPGQISAEDLRNVYRVKELNEETEIYGVIGDPIAHSLSPQMQNAAFIAAGLNAVLVPFEVKDLNSFITRFLPESGLNIKGFAVTIPHKQAIMKYLDEIDETAQKIGAVNTVKIAGGKLYGYNTDAAGFIAPLKNAYGKLRGAKASILGAGGAARACIYALQNEGVEVTVFARDPQKAESLASEFSCEILQLPATDNQSPITINATPLGTKGELEEMSVIDAGGFENVSLAYDLVYNPNVTRFMREAKAAGVPRIIGGLEMLVAQGAEQFRIWTQREAPVAEMAAALRSRLG